MTLNATLGPVAASQALAELFAERRDERQPQ